MCVNKVRFRSFRQAPFGFRFGRFVSGFSSCTVWFSSALGSGFSSFSVRAGPRFGSIQCSDSFRGLLRFTHAIKCREFRGVSSYTIMITCMCNLYPFTPHFYIEKLGFTRVNIIF